MLRPLALLLGLAACVQPLPPPPRTAENPFGAVAEIRTITLRALADDKQVLAQCEIVGPGYRFEVTTPAGVEIPLTPDGRPDATSLTCRRGNATARAAGIAADATDVTAIFERNGNAYFAR